MENINHEYIYGMHKFCTLSSTWVCHWSTIASHQSTQSKYGNDEIHVSNFIFPPISWKILRKLLPISAPAIKALGDATQKYCRSGQEDKNPESCIGIQCNKFTRPLFTILKYLGMPNYYFKGKMHLASFWVQRVLVSQPRSSKVW
jgi:hypothetical protein